MESRKYCRSASGEKKIIDKSKAITKCKCPREKKKKEETFKEGPQDREKLNRSSQIPVLKCEKIDLKSIVKEQKTSPAEPVKSSCSCPCAQKHEKNEEYELRLKVLEEKEKSIAEYYLRIEETLRNLMNQKDQKENPEPVGDDTPQNTNARKMTSDPEVFRKGKWQNKILSDFENNVEEISSIWLKTSADLFKTLNNLKKNSSLDPMEFEVENEKIQVAIKQAKSLTLLKTKSVIAEAQKLYHHGEIIRTELQKLLSTENLKPELGKSSFPPEGNQEWQDNLGKMEANGTGDSTNQIILENIKEAVSDEKREEEYEPVKERAEEKLVSTDEVGEKPIEPNRSNCSPSEIIAEEVETLVAELAKKNETITSLNNKVFELQKACNEHLLKYNQLQSVISEFQEKIQWNQILWKQIGKLKERILGLQQSNKQLEENKKELEHKVTKLDKELERLIKLNQLLNQRKYLMDAQECSGKSCRIREFEFGAVEEKFPASANYFDDEERILSDKQNAINQLKSVLGAMKDQENFAQKQIAMFQSKIEALEKKS